MALGRALASGVLATDDAAVDEEFLFVAALSALDVPHVSLLEFAAEFPSTRSLYLQLQVARSARPRLVGGPARKVEQLRASPDLRLQFGGVDADGLTGDLQHLSLLDLTTRRVPVFEAVQQADEARPPP
jgi:hypothetical protein